MQFQADLSGTDGVRPASAEATARGAAYLAGLTCGFWEDREALRAHFADSTVFTPRMSEEERAARLAGWHRAVRAASAWAADRGEE
jgi:glycerol kinase